MATTIGYIEKYDNSICRIYCLRLKSYRENGRAFHNP
nr:MAG TPA: hypothetical protein [Bacteriophage sp.]DAX15226.1 MAG TPA: hypothetical protein [Bacteriophage sp.]